jgi:hypothetical protein
MVEPHYPQKPQIRSKWNRLQRRANWLIKAQFECINANIHIRATDKISKKRDQTPKYQLI